MNFDGNRDTELGGTRRAFPSTCWSRLVCDFRGPDGRAAAEALARDYWKPIYAFIRAGGAKSNEDAKDLTQDFFVWMVESEFLSKADPERGRFRGFVKAALRQYLSVDFRDSRRLKRGGGKPILSLDAKTGDLPGADPADASTPAPEAALDAAWKRGLLERAERLLAEELGRDGRDLDFKLFRDYYLAGPGDVNYRQLAERHGITEGDVLNHLKFARKRYRLALRTLIGETVDGEAGLAEEWRSLFGDEGE